MLIRAEIWHSEQISEHRNIYKLKQCCALVSSQKTRSVTVPRFGFFQDSGKRVKNRGVELRHFMVKFMVCAMCYGPQHFLPTYMVNIIWPILYGPYHMALVILRIKTIIQEFNFLNINFGSFDDDHKTRCQRHLRSFEAISSS